MILLLLRRLDAIRQVEADADEAAEQVVQLRYVGAGSGGRRIEAMLERRWATLPVPNSTTSMPG